MQETPLLHAAPQCCSDARGIPHLLQAQEQPETSIRQLDVSLVRRMHELMAACCAQKPRKDGNTALHEAAQCGDEKLLIALMRLGADRFSRNQVQPCTTGSEAARSHWPATCCCTFQVQASEPGPCRAFSFSHLALCSISTSCSHILAWVYQLKQALLSLYSSLMW